MPLQNEKSQSPLCQCWFFLFQDVFKLEIDASSVAISAILSQHGHLLDFFSKQIHALFFRVCSRALCCQRSNQEMTSVLDHHHFHIYTNHKSLNSLLSQTIQTLQLQKWASKLQRYNFEIFYKPGTNNTVADALSREFLEEASQMVVSSLVPQVLLQLRQQFSSTKEGKALLHKVETNPNKQSVF